jgi:hypothetical protein
MREMREQKLELWFIIYIYIYKELLTAPILRLAGGYFNPDVTNDKV